MARNFLIMVLVVLIGLFVFEQIKKNASPKNQINVPEQASPAIEINQEESNAAPVAVENAPKVQENEIQNNIKEVNNEETSDPIYEPRSQNTMMII